MHCVPIFCSDLLYDHGHTILPVVKATRLYHSQNTTHQHKQSRRELVEREAASEFYIQGSGAISSAAVIYALRQMVRRLLVRPNTAAYVSKLSL